MTLRQTLTKAIAGGMFIFTLAALSMAYVWYSTPYKYDPATSSEIMSIRPHAQGTVPAVVKANDCKPSKEGVFPTGVVYVDSDSRAHFSNDYVVVGKALDNHFDNVPWEHTPIRFCK